MLPVLQKLTIRLDAATAAAVVACARAERKTPTDVMREGIRLRLEAGAMVDPLRVALGETSAAVLARTSELLAELKADLVARLIETETRERETTRQDIGEFLAVLNQYVQEQTDYMRGVAHVEKPTAKTLREQLAK
ncbi:MAG TPA: hypothetical protein PK080_00100 [Hyphomonadaceae bacterium]|nr:hypothetical protein [Hyphomonadaceae bacterium]